jgi:hypothetical protein
MGPKKYKDMMNYLTRPRMAQGGRTGFKDGMKEMENKLRANYTKKVLKELDAGKKSTEIQSYEDYIKTQKEIDMNPGKKKLDKAIADAKKLIKGNTLSAKIPGVETLLKAADNIKDDIAKKKFLTAGFKTLGIAVGVPLVAYDTYKAFKKGKPVLEALEQGFIGTDLIGGAKRIVSLTPEERTARSVVKQDALKDLNLEMPMGFGFIEGPTPKTDMTLEEAQAKAAAGTDRVKQLEAQKNFDRATNRVNFFGNIKDRILGAPQQLQFNSGGIASGPPPKRGPLPQGLPGLLKRGMKI